MARPLKVEDLRVEPGFKTESKEGLLCYCFQLRRKDIEDGVEGSRRKLGIERVTEAIEADNCACEVRNPHGQVLPG